VLQFDTGRANIVLDSTQKKTFALLSNCIDKEQRNITVTGHTDNTGTSTGNTSLGLQRANFVRDYLIDNGILSQHIQALSKGQIQPKASNKTPEGRAQNRRIEVTIN
jgi:outer membrane protein OmpA-like peptidoglycan-associated protein